MKMNKSFLLAALSLLTVSSLAACSRGSNEMNDWEYDPEATYEVGETVKEWRSNKDSQEVPLDVPEGGTGIREITKRLGHEDKVSLHYQIQSSQNYITSELEEDQFFTDLDVKDGDIVSLYVYIPSNSNLSSLQLKLNSVVQSGYGAADPYSAESNELKVSADIENTWIQLTATYKSVLVLNSIRLNYVPVDSGQEVEFYVDDINIEYGEESVANEYVSNDEHLYKSAEEYLKVGCCMSANQVLNTKARQVVKEQFNSVTAENEGKPEHILDQAACQALSDKSQVVITMKPFENIYDWCYRNHIGVRHHTFVWYSQTPAWFFTTDYSGNGQQASRDLMLKRMENFIKVTLESINERWPGLVYAVDVANEALQQTNIRSNNNKWYDTIGDNGNGDNFVYYAFKYASKYKEDYQELYYNDYEYDYNTSYCEYALNTLLKKAIAENLIDGVGIQGHIDCDNLTPDIENAKLIKQKGLKCQITELDLTTSTNDEGYQKQKVAYKDMVNQILTLNKSGQTDVNALIVWGITDDTSWKRGQDPLLFTSSYKKKPAYYGFLEALNEFEG